jgi:hypothetical protein
LQDRVTCGKSREGEAETTVGAPVQRPGPSPRPASPRARPGQEEWRTEIHQPTLVKMEVGETTATMTERVSKKKEMRHEEEKEARAVG